MAGCHLDLENEIFVWRLFMRHAAIYYVSKMESFVERRSSWKYLLSTAKRREATIPSQRRGQISDINVDLLITCRWFLSKYYFAAASGWEFLQVSFIGLFE